MHIDQEFHALVALYEISAMMPQESFHAVNKDPELKIDIVLSITIIFGRERSHRSLWVCWRRMGPVRGTLAGSHREDSGPMLLDDQRVDIPISAIEQRVDKLQRPESKSSGCRCWRCYQDRRSGEPAERTDTPSQQTSRGASEEQRAHR